MTYVAKKEVRKLEVLKYKYGNVTIQLPEEYIGKNVIVLILDEEEARKLAYDLATSGDEWLKNISAQILDELSRNRRTRRSMKKIREVLLTN